MSLCIYLFFDDCISGKFPWEEFRIMTWLDGDTHEEFWISWQKIQREKYLTESEAFSRLN